MIRVYDGCGKEIQKGNDVFSFSKSIALDLSDSIETVKLLYTAIDIILDIDNATFSSISDEAYLLSRKMTTDQFKEKISTYQPSIEILGEYKSTSNRIACKCGICGHI